LCARRKGRVESQRKGPVRHEIEMFSWPNPDVPRAMISGLEAKSRSQHVCKWPWLCKNARLDLILAI
jgi:hypothetical protein